MHFLVSGADTCQLSAYRTVLCLMTFEKRIGHKQIHIHATDSVVDVVPFDLQQDEAQHIINEYV